LLDSLLQEINVMWMAASRMTFAVLPTYELVSAYCVGCKCLIAS